MSTTEPKSKIGRWLMVIMGAFLMIAFILPIFGSGQPSQGDIELGRAFGEPLTAMEVQSSRDRWEAARNIGGVDDNRQFRSIISYLLPAEAIDAIDREPSLYALLLREADESGITVPANLFQQAIKEVKVRSGNQVLDFNLLPSEATANAYGRALEDVLRVEQSYRRHNDYAFVSQPMVDSVVRRRGRELALQLVPFPIPQAGDTQPSEAQLQAQFEKFKDLSPQNSSMGNPMGYGYRLPDTVKLEVFRLKRASVEQNVRDSRKDVTFDKSWAVEARRYYNANPQEFPADLLETPASTQPSSTQPAATQSAATQSAATQPKVAPFESVQDAIIAKLINRETDERLGRAMQQLRAKLTTMAAQRRAKPDAPADDLNDMLAQLQSRFGVEVEVQSLADMAYPFEDLNAIESLQSIMASQMYNPRTGLPPTLAELAFSLAEPLKSESQKSTPTLRVFEPSPDLEDTANGDPVTFRLTDATPSHAPQSLDEVKAAVTADVQAQLQADAAVRDAEALLASAAGGDLAPHSGDHRVIQTEPFTIGQETLPLPQDARPSEVSDETIRVFLNQAFDLPQEGGVIRLPQANLVYAARVTESTVTSLLPGLDMSFFYRQQLEDQLRNGYFMESAPLPRTLAAMWFDPANIRARSGFNDQDAPATTQPN